MAATFVVIMLLAQIGMAQHHVVHVTDHSNYEHYEHYEHGDDDHDGDHHKAARENCQICLLTKSLSLGLAAHHVALAVPVLSGHSVLGSDDHMVINHQYALYNSRAPPVLFI